MCTSYSHRVAVKYVAKVSLGDEAHLQKEDVLRELLDGFEEEALETEAGLALVVLLPEEGNKLGLLLDGLLQNLHCFGEVIDVLAVVFDYFLAVELRGKVGRREVGEGRWGQST